jgi:hypothetical protein
MTPADLHMLDPSRSNGHSISSQEYPLSFLGSVRNILLASLDNAIDTWRRRTTSRLLRTLILDMVSADDRSNDTHFIRSQEHPLSFLLGCNGDKKEKEHFKCI